MSILNKNSICPQLRSLPVRGGRSPVTYRYTVRVSDRWIEVNHNTAVRIVGAFNSLKHYE